MESSSGTQQHFELSARESHYVTIARSGSPEAIAHLIGLHRARLVRTANNILRDRTEAEDVSQEALLKAFRELHRLRDDRAFSGFVTRIAVRLCLDRLRSKKQTYEISHELPDSRRTNIDTKVVVEKLLELLPAELRTTLVLRELELFSYDEIAESMNVPVGTVRSRLHAAREKFREMWLEANKG